MDKYFNSYREMISLRGLTDHTLKSYCTYIRAYLSYLSHILQKAPEEVSWQELRDYINWLQKSRNLSDRTINCAISQLRFFTMYVLHQPWDDTQLPIRRFDQYLPYVPSKAETWQFISTMPCLKQKTMLTLLYSSGLRIGEVCFLRYEDVDRRNMRLHITHSKTAVTAMPSSRSMPWIFLRNTGLLAENRGAFFFQSRTGKTDLLIRSFSHGTSMPMKDALDGNSGSPVILFDMLSALICTKTVLIYSPSKHSWGISP